jgi:hypothetical protein
MTKHNELCPVFDEDCCPWVTYTPCECQCMCDFINKILDKAVDRVQVLRCASLAPRLNWVVNRQEAITAIRGGIND